MSTTPVVNRTLQAQLDAARERTDQLFDLLKPEALYCRPVPERHRLIFYLGHLEAFDWNQIGRQALDAPSFHPEFDKLFEFGIDPPVGEERADQPRDWPGVEEVRAYNRQVRERIDELLEQAPEQIVNVALEHRLMHAETFAYLLHNVAYEQKNSPPTERVHAARRSPQGMIDIPAGVATLGQRRGEFGWDNEFEEQHVRVPGFAIDKYKITNGQYLEFVKAGAQAPHFWVKRGNAWFYRGSLSPRRKRAATPNGRENRCLLRRSSTGLLMQHPPAMSVHIRGETQCRIKGAAISIFILGTRWTLMPTLPATARSASLN